MLWEIEIRPKGTDPERGRVAAAFDLLTHGTRGRGLISAAARGYLVEGGLGGPDADRLMRQLLVDPLVESGRLGLVNAFGAEGGNHIGDLLLATVLLKPGVMDPAALSVVDAARGLGLEVESVRSFRRYYGREPLPADVKPLLFRRVLANEAVEQVVEGPLTLKHLGLGKKYTFHLVTIPLRELDEEGLRRVSRDGQLSLSLDEMRTIQGYFRSLDRDPTDAELETLAQTWSEHCSHKTLKGRVEVVAEDGTPLRRYDNLLKETIFSATQEVRRRLGADDWCVSVFVDNAGVVRFDERHHVCFKVETHNRPSAIEPYGGASTGIGGVIRDVLGTGLGAKPVANTDIFCFAPPDMAPESLPPGVLHPRLVMDGVVAGVRDYGNRMGIATVNGTVCFDERYVANPLVFCGTVGLLPVEKATKAPQAGDLIVALGGRTGRDGIHGATFSSAELTHQSEAISGGAVQIGNAIAEKKMMDVLLAARDRGLYRAVTDCGAGGFSSAVGEMGEAIGAFVELEKAPLKYEGLSYTEIWISEAQERMVLAVPPEKWEELRALCTAEDVEAAVLGRFEATGRLRLSYEGQQVADLEMAFLHDGRPPVVRRALLARSADGERGRVSAPSPDLNAVLKKILSSWNVCSKEWIVRQYDHEVQGGSVVKPLVGVQDDGPSDAAVLAPVLGSTVGVAIGCGLNPRYGDLDAYAMALCAADEAVRNVVAVGADPARVALLDNFCWGDTDRPEVLGSLVLAAEACRDVALAYGTPFISGKDSLKNEYRSEGRRVAIPPTLLVSALGRVADVRRCVTMDLKEPGNLLFLVGATKDERAGSHFALVTGTSGGRVPRPDLATAPRVFAAVHDAIRRGLVRSCHDLSEGGFAVALAEMAFAGGVGADVTGLAAAAPGLADEIVLFSESTTRFLLEVTSASGAALVEHFAGLPLFEVGKTTKESRLRIAGANGEWVVWAAIAELKEAWQAPLRG